MGTDDQKAMVRVYVEAFNRGDLDAVCRCFTSDALIYGVLGGGELAKARPIWQQLISSFQLKLQVDGMIVERDTVAVRYTERGKFVAPFRGIEPNGKSYEVCAIEWFQMRGGKIEKRWGARDSAAIYRQLGIPLS